MELSIKDIAAALGVQEETIERWAQDGKLPAREINGHYRMNRSELLEWATFKRIAVHPEIATGTDANELEITSALTRGGVHFGVGGDDKPTVLAELVRILPLPAGADRDFLLQVLLAREALGSTGIGNGIAIPHVRNPIVFDVRDPILSLYRLTKPVDFAAIDKKPVDTLFLLICPTIAAHLRSLSRLSFLLKDGDLLHELAGAKTADAMIALFTRAERGLLAAQTGRAGHNG